MKESQNIEWKSEWRDEFLKWICGFANAQGGKIYIGVDDTGNISGIKNAKELLQILPNKILDILGIIAPVNLLMEGEKEYIEIIVEPFSFPVNFRGQYYIRSGSTKQELKGNNLNKFLLGKIGKRWDGVEIPTVSLQDLKAESVQRFRNKAHKSRRVDEDILNDNLEVLLEDLQLLENGFLKRATVLLFHPHPEKYVPGAFIKIGYFKSDDDLAFQDVVQGSIMEQIEKTEELLRTKYFIYTIEYEGISRIEKPPFPEKAIREALLNAVAHKDYSDPNAIQISVYADQIIFWNPGTFPEKWNAQTLKTKKSSKPFNPFIANALFRCGDIEAWGRGTLKMINEAVLNKSLPPDFQSTSNEFTITFFKDVKSAFKSKGLNPALIPIIEFVILNGKITNSDVQKILGIGKRSASRILVELQSDFLVQVGVVGKGTYYIAKWDIIGTKQ